ncbi:MAG: phosphopantetheine-binding protein [Bacteroidota bacterium]
MFDKVTENHSTILCSPNFGYSYVLKHCQDREQSWDLSSVRLVYNGAEPISAQLCQEFLSYMEQYGLRREALCPVYGLAEASLAVSTSSLEDEVISLSLDRDYLNTGAQIRVKDSGLNTASFVNVGTAVNYCSLRIASQNNDLENEGVIGFIQIKGDNVTQGYYSNSRETVRVLSEDGWLNTGDLGFIYQDMLFVTGRYKDIIFSNGQNYYPHDLENIAEEVEGVELNKVVVCGYRDESKEKEEIISFVFYRGKIEDFIPLMNRLKSTINTKVELAIDRVIPVKLIPRTTSGKLQRFRLLELYRSGEFDEVIDTIERLEAENDANFIQPETELEKELANIWHDILKSNNVDVTVDFYALGGTSLKLAEMAMMVKQKMNVDLSTSILSTNRNIRDLAQAISILDKSEYQPIPIAVEQENYLLSSAQNRIYHACQINKSSTAYNLPVVLELKGKLDVTQLNQTV